jgi:hypothetical protein
MTFVESVNEKSGVVALNAENVGAVSTSELGQPGGAATLDESGSLTRSQLPSSVGTGSLTVAGLREAVAVEGLNYFLSELGKEGWWRLDPADTTSADNLGTILVTEGGQRLKRVLSPNVGYAPEWFGAKGDWKDTTATLGEGTDDTAAFQACADAIISADAGRMILSRKYLIEGTVFLNQSGEGLKWVPVDLRGYNDAAAGSRGHSCAIVKRKAGAAFRVNLDAGGKTVLAPTEQYLGFSYGGFSFIGKSLEEKEEKGVPVTGMVGIEVFRTRCNQGAGMYCSQFDYLMYQPDKDAAGNENYCDASTYETCRIAFSTKSGMKLNKNDGGRVGTIVFDSPLSTATGALELKFGAGTKVEGVVFHTASTEWTPTEESALIYAYQTRALKIGVLHIERQLAFHSTINLLGCRNTKIENAHTQYQGNTFLRNNKSVGTELCCWDSLDKRESGYYDIEFLGNAAENVGYRQGPLDLKEESGVVRAPIVLNAGVQGPLELLSGSYFFPASAGGSGTSATLGNNLLRVYPIDIREVTSIAAIGAEITAIGEAGCTYRLGVWTEKNGVPDKLLQDFGTIDGHSATVQDAVAGPVILTPGRYFIGGALQGAPTTQPTVRICNAAVMPVSTLSSAKPTANQLFIGFMQEGVSGTLGNWTAGRSIASSGLVPRLHLKVS